MQKFSVLFLLLMLVNMVMGKGVEQKFQASLMIAEPYMTTTQGMYGHAFLRMQYPAEGLDYCFTLETGDDDESAFDIVMGNYTSRMMAFKTAEYMPQFAHQKREVAQLNLNLTDKEIQDLWRTLDGRITDTEQNIPSDYFTHGCAAELTNILFDCIDGVVEFDDIVCDSIGRTYMQVGNTYRPLSSWSIVAMGFCFAEGMHEQRTADYLTYAPVALPYMFSHATIASDGGKRPLLASMSTKVTTKDGKSSVRKAGQVHFFEEDTAIPVRLYLIIIIAAQILLAVFARKTVKYANALMFTCYNVITVLMLLLSGMTGITELTGWNWLMFFYNPLPLLLWVANRLKPVSLKTEKRIVTELTAWAVVCVANMAVRSDMILLEQTLIAAAFTIQLIIANINFKHK